MLRCHVLLYNLKLLHGIHFDNIITIIINLEILGGETQARGKFQGAPLCMKFCTVYSISCHQMGSLREGSLKGGRGGGGGGGGREGAGGSFLTTLHFKLPPLMLSTCVRDSVNSILVI